MNVQIYYTQKDGDVGDFIKLLIERDLWRLCCGTAFVDFFLFEVELYSLLIIDEDIIDWNSSNGPKVGVI